jgi:uncharacterized DUF497 family protein
MDPYEWDEAKNTANRLKHGVSFEILFEFDWTSAVVRLDDRYDYGERRFRAFGRIRVQAYCIAFTSRHDIPRIIRVRRMHDKEAKRYGIQASSPAASG